MLRALKLLTHELSILLLMLQSPLLLYLTLFIDLSSQLQVGLALILVLIMLIIILVHTVLIQEQIILKPEPVLPIAILALIILQ